MSWLWLPVVPSCLSAQEQPVQGFVADAATSVLIPQATVTLVTTGDETVSGSDGGFAFSEAPVGPISVQVDAPGYQSVLWTTEVVPGRPLFLEIFLSRLAGDASFRVFVTDEASGEPVAGAGVAFPELGSSGVTDDTGEAVVTDIPEGTWLVLITGLGYGSATSFVEFDGTSRVEGDVALGEAPISLDGIVVSGDRGAARLELVGFESRRQAGLGYHFDAADLERVGATIPSDLFRRSALAGIYVDCTNGRECIISSRRGPGNFSGRSTCAIPVFVDGVQQGRGGFGLDDFPVNMILGIEVYNGISSVPTQFYVDGACGAVLVWTRR
jgi:hypothetical protein